MLTINAEVHKKQDKGASRHLCTANKFPIIVYGGREAPSVVELNRGKAMNIQAKVEFYSEVLTIIVGGKEIRIKAQGVQRHPYRPKLLHIDLVRA